MLFGPHWWHHHGIKMCVVSLDKEQKKLTLAGSAASITIFWRGENIWLATYQIDHSSFERSMGTVRFSGEILRQAFCFVNGFEESSQWLDKRYNANAAAQGKYIRWEGFLNIPCPGTGNDGDPNISIYVSDEIEKAVEQLLG